MSAACLKMVAPPPKKKERQSINKTTIPSTGGVLIFGAPRTDPRAPRLLFCAGRKKHTVPVAEGHAFFEDAEAKFVHCGSLATEDGGGGPGTVCGRRRVQLSRSHSSVPFLLPFLFLGWEGFLKIAVLKKVGPRGGTDPVAQ